MILKHIDTESTIPIPFAPITFEEFDQRLRNWKAVGEKKVGMPSTTSVFTAGDTIRIEQGFERAMPCIRLIYPNLNFMYEVYSVYRYQTVAAFRPYVEEGPVPQQNSSFG